MGNFAENLNLGNRFRPPPRIADLGNLWVKIKLYFNCDFNRGPYNMHDMQHNYYYHICTTTALHRYNMTMKNYFVNYRINEMTKCNTSLGVNQASSNSGTSATCGTSHLSLWHLKGVQKQRK